MHQIGMVLAGEDVTGHSHIRGELINLSKAAVDDSGAESGIPQIADDKIIGFALREFMKLQVDTPHPVSIALQPFYQVAADEAACATDQCTLRHNASPCASTSCSPQLLGPGWLVRQQKTLIPRSGHEILQPSRTAPHQDSQASLVFISIFGTMEAGNHTAAGADAPAAPDCGCGRTLLAQIARRNQLTVTGSVAAVFR